MNLKKPYSEFLAALALAGWEIPYGFSNMVRSQFKHWTGLLCFREIRDDASPDALRAVVQVYLSLELNYVDPISEWAIDSENRKLGDLLDMEK